MSHTESLLIYQIVWSSSVLNMIMFNSKSIIKINKLYIFINIHVYKHDLDFYNIPDI